MLEIDLAEITFLVLLRRRSQSRKIAITSTRNFPLTMLILVCLHNTRDRKVLRYGWDGGFGTSFLVDPKRDLISIVMTKSSDYLFNGARDQFWRELYTATA